MSAARAIFSERSIAISELDLQGEDSGRCTFVLHEEQIVRCGELVRIVLDDGRQVRARIDGVMFIERAVHCSANWEPFSGNPAAPQAPSRPPSQEPAITTAERWSSPIVVVIEDDDDVRAVLSEVLEQCGIRVLAAQNGRHALDMLSKSEEIPALILLDLMMPEMDGWTFRESQKKDARLMKVPVVAISAARFGDLTIDVELLEKPFDLERLLRAVRAYCFGSQPVV